MNGGPPPVAGGGSSGNGGGGNEFNQQAFYMDSYGRPNAMSSTGMEDPYIQQYMAGGGARPQPGYLEQYHMAYQQRFASLYAPENAAAMAACFPTQYFQQQMQASSSTRFSPQSLVPQNVAPMGLTAPLVTPRPSQRTLTSVWQRTPAETNMGVPLDHYLVSYEALRPSELRLASSVDSTESTAAEESPAGISEIEQPWTGSRNFSFNVACDVCLEWSLLRDVSGLSSEKLYVLGRQAQQSHQCVGCGIVVHRLCYGITGCLLKDSLFFKATPLAQAKLWGRKAVPAPKLPLIQLLWERSVASPLKTSYCRFLCDVCLYLSQMAASSPNSKHQDLLETLPLGGRCLLCANARGPRKLVTVDRVERSSLPEMVFAHAFCMVTASRGICRIRDWKNLTGIIIDENALLIRRNQLAPHLKSPFACELCHEGGASQLPIGCGLEPCRHLTLASGDGECCVRLSHPICLRNVAAEYAQRNNLSYHRAFDNVIAPRVMLGGKRLLAFGLFTCLTHAFTPEDSALQKRICGQCHDSHVDPVYPNSWTICSHCHTDMHVTCTENAGAPFRLEARLCRSCSAAGEALQLLLREWEVMSLAETRGAFNGSDCYLQHSLPITLASRVLIARQRISDEQFSRTFATSLSHSPGSRALLADALVAVMATKFFNGELTQAQWKVPVKCSLQSYILLKAIYSKRQHEWLLATHTVPFVPSIPLHPLLESKGRERLPSLSAHVQVCPASIESSPCVPTCDQETPPNTDNKPTMKKRFLMRKQPKAATDQSTTQSLDVNENDSVSLGGGPRGDDASSATLNTSRKGNSSSRIASMHQKAKSKLLRPKQPSTPKKRPNETKTADKKKRRTDTASDCKSLNDSTQPALPVKEPNLRALNQGTSLFSLLLLLSLFPVLPISSQEEVDSHSRLRDLALSSTQLLTDMLHEISTFTQNPKEIPLRFYIKVEYIRRVCLSTLAPLIDASFLQDQGFIMEYTGAKWIQWLLKMSTPDQGLEREWKTVTSHEEDLQELFSQDRSCLLALGSSFELQSTRWLILLCLVKEVIESRFKPQSIDGVEERLAVMKEACSAFNLSQLRAVAGILKETNILVAMNFTSTPSDELERHFQRYSHLFRIVSGCIQHEASVFETPEKHRDLPYPFLIYLATYYSQDPQRFLMPMPASLLPPPLLFHAKAPAGANDEQQPSIGGTIGVIAATIKELELLIDTSSQALDSIPVDLDLCRNIIKSIEAIDLPAGYEELRQALRDIKHLVAQGDALEQFGDTVKSDWKSLRTFTKAFGTGNMADAAKVFQQQLEANNEWTHSLSNCLGGKFTSEKLRGFPKLVIEVEEWRRKYAKLRAMLAPTCLTEKAAAPNRRRGKLRLTAGGAVKVSGETGFLRPGAQLTEPGTTETTDAGKRLTFSNQVPISQALHILESGKALEVELPELCELDEWVQMCRRYEVKLRDSSQLFVESVLLMVFSTNTETFGNRFQSTTPEELTTRLMAYRRPCLACVSILVATPLELQSDYSCLPFAIENSDQSVVTRCLEALKLFLISLRRFARQTDMCSQEREALSVDLEKELMEYTCVSAEQEVLDMKKRKTKTVGQSAAITMPDFAIWIRQAADIFEVTQARVLDCVMLQSLSTNDTGCVLTPEQWKESGFGDILRQSESMHCPNCSAGGFESEFNRRPFVRRCLTYLWPFFKILVQVYDQVLIQQFTFNTMAFHITSKISMDRRFHPSSLAGSVPLIQEKAMLSAFKSLCVEIYEIHKHGNGSAAWANVSQVADYVTAIESLLPDLDNESHPFLLWRVCAISLLTRLFAAVLVMLNTTLQSAQDLGITQWKTAICGGLQSLLTNAVDVTETLPPHPLVFFDELCSLEQKDNGAIKLCVPWKTEVLKAILLRSLSLLGLFLHYISTDSTNVGDYPVVTMHYGLTRLLKSVDATDLEAAFDRSIYAIVRQATWERRAREALRQTQLSLRCNSMCLQPLILIISEISQPDNLGDLNPSAVQMYEEATRILREAFLRSSAVCVLINWLRDLSPRSDILASEVLFQGMMFQELQQQLAPIAASRNVSNEQMAQILEEIVSELQPLLSAKAEAVAAVRDSPQACLLWRLCRGTTRLLLTPAASSGYLDVPVEVILNWLKGATTWTATKTADTGTWANLAGGSIPGQVVAIDTMRLASVGLTSRAFCSSVLNDVARLASSSAPNRVFSPLDVAVTSKAPTDSPMHYFMGTILPMNKGDNDADFWSCALQHLPWASVVFSSYLKGVATFDVEEDWELVLPSINEGDKVNSQEFLASAHSELAAFVRLCECREQLLRHLIALTVPRVVMQDVASLGSEPMTCAADQISQGDEDEPSELRTVLSLAIRHSEWLRDCAVQLGPKGSTILTSARYVSQLAVMRDRYLELRQALLTCLEITESRSAQATASSSGLLSNLLFGDLSSEWQARRTSQQLNDAIIDLFLGGVLQLELKRCLSHLTVPDLPPSVPSPDKTLVGESSHGQTLKHQVARLVSLIEVLTPTELSEAVANWSLATSLSFQQTLQPFQSGSPVLQLDSDFENSAAVRMVFYPEGNQVRLPHVPEMLLPHEELFWFESTLSCAIETLILQDERDLPKDELQSFAASVSLQLQNLLQDDDQSQVLRVKNTKILWSFIVDDEMVSLCVCLEILKGGEKSLRFKFLSPLLLVALIECAPMKGLLKRVPGLNDQFRDFFRNLADSNLKLPKSLSVIARFLAIRSSVASEMRLPALFYNLASDVLRRVDLLGARCFPIDMVENMRQLFCFQNMTAELTEICSIMRNVMSPMALQKVQQGNAMLATHPPKLCFLDLACFQQNKTVFQPLVDKITAILEGTERSNLFTLLQLSQNVAQLIHRTMVSHPCFEQFQMMVEESLSIVGAFQEIAHDWKASVNLLLTTGRGIFEQYWNTQQATLTLLPIRRTPSHHSVDLLLHCFGWSDLGTPPPIICHKLSVLNCRRKSCVLASLKDDASQIMVLAVIDQVSDFLITAETQVSDALVEISAELERQRQLNVAIDQSESNPHTKKVSLTLLVKLFLFPKLPSELQQWVMPPSAPDLSHLLGVPSPFGLFDVISSNKLSVGRAISGWTIFIIAESLKVLECHEILYGGPDAPVASAEALRLGMLVGHNFASPPWAQHAESLLMRLIHLIPICCDLDVLKSNAIGKGQLKVVHIMQIRFLQLLKLGMDNHHTRLQSIIEIFSQYPEAVEAVQGFVNQTGISKMLFKCLWETVVCFLPCKGDPFNTGHTQPIFKEQQTNNLILPPSSATAHKLFGMGKVLLREAVGVPVEGENGFLDNVPPALHPELEAFCTRSHLGNTLPNYTPWAKRAEKLCESLKSTLQYGKILIGEARSSVEAFVSRLSLYGICPVLSMTDDFRGFKTKLESRVGVKIEAGDTLVAKVEDAEMVEDVKGDIDNEYITEAELHRLNWLATAVGPSLMLPQVTKKGVAFVTTSASPAMAQWVEGQYFPESRDLLTAKCKEALPLTQEATKLFELLLKFCSHLTATLSIQEIEDSTPIHIVDTIVHKVPRRFCKKRFCKMSVGSDETLLLLLAAHLIASPFDLGLLRHPILLAQMHPSFDQKVIYPSMLIISKFLNFHGPTVAENDHALRQPSDLLNRQMLQCLASHIFSRSFTNDQAVVTSTSSGLFSAQELLSQDTGNRARNTVFIPPTKPLVRLLPELQNTNRTAFLDYHQKKQVLDRRISAEVAWWGSLVAPGKDFATTYTSHVLIKNVADLESTSLQTLMALVVSFVKFDPSCIEEEKLWVDSASSIPESASLLDGGSLSLSTSSMSGCRMENSSQTTREGSADLMDSDCEGSLLRTKTAHVRTSSAVSGIDGLEEGEARESDDSVSGGLCMRCSDNERLRCDTLSHFLKCAISTTDFTEVCPACRRFYFTSNPNIASKWVTVKSLSEFSKTRTILPSSIESLKLMLGVITPLRLPVVLLPEYPESFLGDIFPVLTAFNCDKEKGACVLLKSRVPSQVLGFAPRVLRFDGLLSDMARELLPTLRVQLYFSLSSFAFHSSCVARAFKKPLQLQNPRQLAFFATLMIYDEAHTKIPKIPMDNDLLPPPTFRATHQNEPESEYLIIKDSNRALMAFSNIIGSLNESLKDIQAKEPLLATRHNSESPVCEIPHFEKSLQRTSMSSIIGQSYRTLRCNGYGVTCLHCAVHKAALLLAVDPFARAVATRATKHEQTIQKGEEL